MFRQASNRYPRSKGFKVKHAFQIALLAAVTIWLLYQVKHSHDKRQTYAEKQTNTKVESSDEVANGWNSDSFGRKEKFEVSQDVPLSADITTTEGNTEEEEEEAKDLHNKSEENDNEDRGVGDDEIDRHDEEKIEEDETQNEHEKIRENAMKNEEGKEIEAGEDETQNEHEKIRENAMKNEEEKEEVGEEETQNENEKIRENAINNEEGKEVEVEDEEHNVDVGAKFVQMKHGDDSTEETQESNDEQQSPERILENDKVENHTVGEEQLVPPLVPGGEDMEKDPLGVLQQNETAADSPSPKGENTEDKLSNSVKTEEAALKQNETTSVDTSKNASILDPDAETQSEKQEDMNKATDVNLAENHVLDMEQNGTFMHKSLNVPGTLELKNEAELTNKTELEDIERVSLQGQSTAKSEAEMSNITKPEDMELVSSLDQNAAMTENNSSADVESSSKTDDASEAGMISISPERNSNSELGQPDGGDATQDISEENEVAHRTDLEILPHAETDGQNSEEISVQ
eukprot:Gb_38294 [translate_table: standard]